MKCLLLSLVVASFCVTARAEIGDEVAKDTVGETTTGSPVEDKGEKGQPAAEKQPAVFVMIIEAGSPYNGQLLSCNVMNASGVASLQRSAEAAYEVHDSKLSPSTEEPAGRVTTLAHKRRKRTLLALKLKKLVALLLPLAFKKDNPKPFPVYVVSERFEQVPVPVYIRPSYKDEGYTDTGYEMEEEQYSAPSYGNERYGGASMY